MYRNFWTYFSNPVAYYHIMTKALVYITHFICNLHNQKLQHYVLGKNPTSVQNAITLAQKRDAELCIIGGLHNHNSGHKKLTTFMINRMIVKTTWDPVMLVMAHI